MSDVTGDHPGPIYYAVQDRRLSGEWRTIGEYTDLQEARAAAELIRFHGGNSRIETIEAPIAP